MDDTFIDTLACNTELLTLNLSQTAVTNKGLLCLCKRVPHINTLIAEGCSSLQGSIPGLCALAGLSHLSLCGCRDVSPADVLLSISSATGLTKLNLSWCQGKGSYGKDATRALVALQGLQVLLLDNTRLPDPVAALHAALGLRCLTQLSMSGFTFPDCVDPSLYGSDGGNGSSEEQDELCSHDSATIAASWPGSEVAHLTPDESRHMCPFDHAAAQMFRRVASAPRGCGIRPSRLTMLTLWSANVRPGTPFSMELVSCHRTMTSPVFGSSLLRLLHLWWSGT